MFQSIDSNDFIRMNFLRSTNSLGISGNISPGSLQISKAKVYSPGMKVGGIHNRTYQLEFNVALP